MMAPGVELVKAEIDEIDTESSVVQAGGKKINYDYLVIALGADLAPGALPGYDAAAHNFFDLDGAASLWSSLQDVSSGRIALLVSAMPFKCPAAPYEAILLLHDHFQRKGLRKEVELAIYTPESAPMGVAGPAMGQAVVKMLEDQDITFNPEVNASEIDPERKVITFSGGREEGFDFLAAVPPHKPPGVVKQSHVSNEAGWIPVDKHSLQTSVENVYAIGDVTAITLTNGKPLPKAGVFAHGEAEIVASRIAAAVKGKSVEDLFDGIGYCWIETGAGSAAFASGRFYAEPDPDVPLPKMGKMWHWGKVMFESYWLGDGLRRSASRVGLNLGARVFNIPSSL